MSVFMAAIAKRNGDIITDPEYTDEHYDLVRVHRLRDSGIMGSGERDWAPVEFLPPLDLSRMGNIDEWRLTTAGSHPEEWWDEVKDQVLDKLRARVQRMFVRENTDVLLGGPWILLSGKVHHIRGRVLFVSPEASLKHADLTGVDMEGAYLKAAFLSFAKMDMVRLSQATMDGASFYGANLERADLSLSSARRVCFDLANLTRATLAGADLTGVDMSRATKCCTLLPDQTTTNPLSAQVNSV